jgi:hypothetical protein
MVKPKFNKPLAYILFGFLKIVCVLNCTTLNNISKLHLAVIGLLLFFDLRILFAIACLRPFGYYSSALLAKKAFVKLREFRNLGILFMKSISHKPAILSFYHE